MSDSTKLFILKNLYQSCMFDMKKEHLSDLLYNHNETLMISFKISTNTRLYNGRDGWQTDRNRELHFDFIDKVGEAMPYLYSEQRGVLAVDKSLNVPDSVFGSCRVYSHPDDLHLTVPFSVFEKLVSVYIELDLNVNSISVLSIYDAVKVEYLNLFFEMLKPDVTKHFVSEAREKKQGIYYKLDGSLYPLRNYGDSSTLRDQLHVDHFKQLRTWFKSYINDFQRSEAFVQHPEDNVYFRLKSKTNLKKLKKSIKLDLQNKFKMVV